MPTAARATDEWIHEDASLLYDTVDSSWILDQQPPLDQWFKLDSVSDANMYSLQTGDHQWKLTATCHGLTISYVERSIEIANFPSLPAS
jgi:hypothetical protein